VRTLLAIFVLIAASPRARAEVHGSISDEFSGGYTGPSGLLPPTWYLSDRLGGVLEFKRLSLHLDGQYTYDAPSAAPAGTNFSTSADNIFLLDLGVDWEATRRWAFGAEIDYSPPSRAASDVPLDYTYMAPLQNGSQQSDGQLISHTSSVTGLLSCSFDTGEGNWETAVDASVSATEYFATEKVDAVWSEAQMRSVTPRAIVDYCATHPCPRGSLAALRAEPADLFQAKLSLGVTETIHDRTDIGILGAYYLYDRDPTTVGYYSRIAAGRTAVREASFGGGLPIAPYLFTVKPTITRRFNRALLQASFQFGQYVSDAQYSYDLTLAAKVQFKVSDKVKMWLKLSGQRDVDSNGVISFGGSLAVGTRYSL
jgi:hypothetical protein